jgi:hypothetical protein
MGSQFLGVSPFDPLTYASVAVLLGIATLLACWLPARRAARGRPDGCPARGVDPSGFRQQLAQPQADRRQC